MGPAAAAALLLLVMLTHRPAVLLAQAAEALLLVVVVVLLLLGLERGMGSRVSLYLQLGHRREAGVVAEGGAEAGAVDTSVHQMNLTLL
jgi:hypothetical protein